MANDNKVALGVIGIVVLIGLSKTQPNPPPMCKIPLINGSFIYKEINEIPCDDLVKQALEEIRKARELPQQLPHVVTIESTPSETAPYEIPQPTPQQPAFQATVDQMKKFGEPFDKP